MLEIAFSVGRLVLALILVALNGFFVASEFAFVRVRATSVEQLAAEGRPGSETLQDVMANLDDYLAVTQLGITIASLGLGWVGEPAVADLIEPVLEPLLPGSLIHLIAFGIGFSVITFLHVVFGELAPKTVAIAQAERLSLFVAPPMKVCYFLFYPGLVVFNGTANAFTSMLGVPPASESEETLDEREIRRVLGRSGEAGQVDEEEVTMIERVFELDDISVREIMVPRPDVVTVPSTATVSDLQSTIETTGHTRYPVVDTDEDDRIVGFIDVKDVLAATQEDSDGTTTAGDLAREIIVVPESTTASALLLQFRSDHQQMAAVIDEWGSFEGIATVEDVVEAVVGDLRDEFDRPEEEPTIHRNEDGGYEIDGGVSVADTNEALGVAFESEEFDTIAGMVLGRLGRAPEPGDQIEAGDYELEVKSVDGKRIETVQVRPLDRDEE